MVSAVIALPSVLARAVAAGRPRRAGEILAIASPYRPWWAQRWLHRSRARFRVLIAGRGVGKTHACAWELLQLVLAAPPGSEGAVLAPTFTHTEASIAKLRELSAVIPGADWREQKKRLLLPGNRSIRVFSADRKETVRGPSLVALWLDEGALIHRKAIEASLPALRSAAGVQVKLLLSTTPAGKTWAWEWWEEAADPKSGMERFRFKATDSPFQDQFVIQKARRLMSAEKFAQEYEAEFVDSLILVFPDRSALFVPELPARKRAQVWLGVDIGKTKDWTVTTAANEWGDVRMLGRWQVGSLGMSKEKFWGQTDERVIALVRAEEAKGHDVTVVIDTGGAGGTAGNVMAEKLRGASPPIKVIEVGTHNMTEKARIVEQAQADVEWQKLKVLHPEHPDDEASKKACLACQLDYEMSKFQGLKRVIHGQEVNVYEGPQLEGEHDDCVISFCLANWGRSRGDRADNAPVDLASYLPPGALNPGGRAQPGGVPGGGLPGGLGLRFPPRPGPVGGGGYIFR
jgi:hypothetical protein